MKLIYISSCITHGDKNYNWYIAAQVQVALMRAGFACINPMSSMLMPESTNIDYETWLRMDERIISSCDIVLALPHGHSPGRSRECLFAMKRGIPVLTPADFPCLQELYPGTADRVSADDLCQWIAKGLIDEAAKSKTAA